MTNIEKVKRILDAGHWVKVTYDDGIIRTFTSYYEDRFSCIKDDCLYANPATTINGTIEVIQRIPTPYVAGDKVLVLSNPSPDIIGKEAMVWKVCEIKLSCTYSDEVYNEDKSNSWSFPSWCLAPAFDEDSLSGKEAKIVIDGKEYSVTLKLI